MKETKELLTQMLAIGNHRASKADLAPDPGLDWIVEIEKGSEAVVYGSAEGVFLYTLIIYKDTQVWDTDELLNWNFGACEEWRIAPQPNQSWQRPLQGCGTRTFERADNLVYLRSNEGMLNSEMYVEIDQRLSHSLGLHWRDEVHGWGRINSQGDWETILTCCTETSAHDRSVARLVTMKRAALDSLASALGGQAVTVFDVVQMAYGATPEAGHDDRTKETIGPTGTRTMYRSSIGVGASYTRGIQLLCPNRNLSWGIHGEADEQLAVPLIYKIFDWRNGLVRDVSYQNNDMTNYFENEEGKAYDMSPAFFTPDVVAKYKGDDEKYEVSTNSIRCRNAWYLQYYNFDPGQNLVYAFIKDLQNLPSREQLHWIAHNVRPTRTDGKFGPITRHTERVLFFGDWDSDMAPLDKLKSVVGELNGKWWWTPPEAKHLARAGTAMTESVREWGEEVKYLHQVVVESLNERALRKDAVENGMTREEANGLRSIKLLRSALIRKGMDDAEADNCVQVFFDLAQSRNIGDAHRSTVSRERLIRDKRKQHGTLNLAYTAAVIECIQSLERIRQIL